MVFKAWQRNPGLWRKFKPVFKQQPLSLTLATKMPIFCGQWSQGTGTIAQVPLVVCATLVFTPTTRPPDQAQNLRHEKVAGGPLVLPAPRSLQGRPKEIIKVKNKRDRPSEGTMLSVRQIKRRTERTDRRSIVSQIPSGLPGRPKLLKDSA